MSDQRRIVITGVSRGLGLAMTEEFIRRGHIVLGCARSSVDIAGLRKRFPAPHDFAVVDVSQEAQVGTWAARLLAESAPPDLLVNNAALINVNAPLWQVPPDEFSRVIDVNVKGTYYTIRHFVPAMIQRNSGVVVNFSSGWGRSTSADVAPYCATKWAVEGMTQALAEELPPGMAAVPLNPGIIRTEMLESCFGQDAAAYPGPDRWAQNAVPFLLELRPQDNGKPLTVPG
jgi:NAD(P)-dependent dehydrogenase (short-subunit alcohol dehydrogenase family)